MLCLSVRATLAISAGPEIAADGVAAERQRQAGLIAPPAPEIDDAVQPGLVVGELALVDDQPGLVLAGEHFGNDLVEGNDYGLDLGREELQRQVGGGQRARDGDAHALDLVERVHARRDDHRPIALAHAAAAGQQRVLVLDVRIGVEGDRGHIVEALERLAVQGLDVAQRVR